MSCTPIFDIADFLPPAPHHSTGVQPPSDEHAIFTGNDGLSAFASQDEYATGTTISMHDSAQRIVLSVWLKDGMQAQIDGDRHTHQINHHDVMLSYLPGNLAHAHFGGQNHHVGLVLPRQALEALDGCAFRRIQTTLQKRGGVCIQPAHAQLLRSAHELQEVLNTAGNSRLLKQAKSLEFLARSLEPWHDPANQPQPTPGLRQQTRLRQARECLLRDLAHAPDISTLAQVCGMNTFELKRGFRELFGMSVHALYQHERMHHAWQLIHSGDMTAQEAGESVGYRNMSHFGAAFRREFGILPGELRRKTSVLMPY